MNATKVRFELEAGMIGERYRKGHEVNHVKELIMAVLRASARVPEDVQVSTQGLGKLVIFRITASPIDEKRLFEAEQSAGRALPIIVEALSQSLGLDFGLHFVSSTPSPKSVEI